MEFDIGVPVFVANPFGNAPHVRVQMVQVRTIKRRTRTVEELELLSSSTFRSASTASLTELNLRSRTFPQ